MPLRNCEHSPWLQCAVFELSAGIGLQGLHTSAGRGFIVDGNATLGQVDYAVGALADDESFGVVYTPTARNLTLKMPARGDYTLRWFDPTNGMYRPRSVKGTAGASVVMSHLGSNASNAADWVIVVQG